MPPSSSAIIGWRSFITTDDFKVYMPVPTHSMVVKRSGLSQSSFRACRTYGIRCLASKNRGFGNEPAKKKGNNSKLPKESIRIASEPSKFVSGSPKTRTQQAPEITTGVNHKRSNAILDRQFLEKVEAVRRSAHEQKKADEEKNYQAIDYDAPIEQEQNTVGLGTKVGVGVAVVVFGLVFALADFAPSTSVAPNDDLAIVEKQLTDKEKATLKERLKQYEAVLSSSPGDPTALEERPNDIEAYRLLGEVKYELKDFEGSASAYRSSLSASNDINFDVLRGLTNSLLGAKKPSEAVQVLLSFREKLNDVRPDSSDILVDANSKLGQNTQKFDPIQVELLLGKAYSDWGHVSDAVAVYDQLISNHPNDFRGYLAKGIILKENGKLGDAERMFIQARFFAPEKAKIIVDRYSRQ